MLLDAFGCRWRLDVSGLGPDLGPRVEELWSRAAVADESEDGEDGCTAPVFVVTRGSHPGLVVIDGDEQDATDDEVPYAVSRALTFASIVRRTGECLMLHAAGVAAADGSTVALVAASGTGKTTAASRLGRRLGYVTDETVAVEDDLRVRAYPKPLSVVVDPTDPHGKSAHSPDELGLLTAPADLRLVATVVLERTDEVDAPVLEPFALVDAATLVLPQTSALPSLERPLDRLAEVLVAGHGPWRLRYREIEDCATIVAELAAGRTPGGLPEKVEWQWLAGSADPATAAARQQPPPVPPPPGVFVPDLVVELDTVVVRAPYDDALVSDGAVLVLQDALPTTLPGLAARAWLAATEPTSVARLVEDAEDGLGSHPEAERLVLGAVRSLVEGGLLRAR